MEAVIAGWFAGYVMGIASTIALLMIILKTRATSIVIDRWLSRDIPGGVVAIPVFLGATMGWTMIGLVLGSAYRVGFEDTAGGLGSPSLSYTLSMIVLSLFPLPPLLFLVKRLWWLWAGMSVLFAASFGWGVPWLAE